MLSSRFCTGQICAAFVALAVSFPFALAAQGNWPVYGGDAANTRYSPLNQISPGNVASLQPVWKWDSGEAAQSFQTTPLVIDHVMYVSTPRESVVALDADSGKQLWTFDLKLTFSATHRGLAYWRGDNGDVARIVVATTDGRIFELDAKNGLPIASFGKGGVVDYRATLAAKFPGILFGFSSPPAVYRNLIIFGPRTAESGPKGPDASIRALDVRTGKEVWAFHTLPRPGEPGYETWGPDFWKDGGGPSAWAGISVDEKRGIVFVPVGNPTGGGDPAGRKGTNLYSDSVVALNANTGKLIWHYQMVHHDIWDYDVPASPTLVTVSKGGRNIPAVAQVTKNGLMFVLNRLTGKPIFGVEERPVPISQRSDEELSPTQPFPVMPAPLARNSMSLAEVSKLTPESTKYCSQLLASLDSGGPFLPRSDRGSITFPSSIGGGNWGGVAYEARLGLIYVNTSNLGSRSMPARAARPSPASEGQPQSEAAASRPITSGGNRFVDQERYPCNQPPWGQMTALDANTGDIAWQVTLGSYKALEDKGISGTGAVNGGAPMVTAGGVLFIGATNDQRFRAFDARTGKLLWQVDLDGDALAEPMTFLGRDGKQKIAVSVGGPGLLGGVGPVQPSVNGQIIVYGLPH